MLTFLRRASHLFFWALPKLNIAVLCNFGTCWRIIVQPDDLEMDSDSDFGEGDDRGMDAADMRKMADKLGKDGFRIGKAQEEEKQMQIGFDQGFDRGLQLGKVSGSIYAKVICAVQRGPVSKTDAASNLSKLESILMDTIPDDLEVCQSSIEDLELLLGNFPCDVTDEMARLKNLLDASAQED